MKSKFCKYLIINLLSQYIKDYYKVYTHLFTLDKIKQRFVHLIIFAGLKKFFKMVSN